ncbi:GntR family transcriptional regulator [Nakamurella flavida]
MGTSVSTTTERVDLGGRLPTMFGSTTLPSRIHDQLESAIITGTLQPGQRLHADDLAAHYGVSRIPVREALRSLHEAGWVDIKPRHGVRVRERSETELMELFEFRAVVEDSVARWAAARRTDDQLATLQDAVDGEAAAVRRRDTDSLVLHTARFHAALRAAAHNSVLEATSAEMEKRARFYFSTVAADLGDHWIEIHRELTELVAASRAREAGKVAARHIAETGAAVRSLLFP